MTNIQMVDLKGQYAKISEQIDEAVFSTIRDANFINGPSVKSFQANLEAYLSVEHVIPCANGTDALQIALMALELKAGDEVIVPAFTYVATAEVISLLGFVPVMAEVDPDSFNISIESIESLINEKTKAIVPVHLYGQSADMEPIMNIAKNNSLYVIEDNAQAIGATYTFSNGEQMKTGTIGHIGTTSFFPSKNLGCYGDGGALMTRDETLAERIRMIANHGQLRKYHHEITGVNSRLDSIQAAILDVKLKYLNNYIQARNNMASYYDASLKNIEQLEIPKRSAYSDHVFHQYTLKISEDKRDPLKEYLARLGIPSMVYYPLPLYKQKAFNKFVRRGFQLELTEELCSSVLSLPIHTEGSIDEMKFIVESIQAFYGITK
ncbi:DegT/DnrJ/EryC1/StrS family aminotransferase [Schleiferiaceae bacterium]|nr:DegT/DnrJ/EryC1/StrS family aminotransferase [Schleiferiaceae bacterium]